MEYTWQANHNGGGGEGWEAKWIAHTNGEQQEQF